MNAPRTLAILMDSIFGRDVVIVAAVEFSEVLPESLWQSQKCLIIPIIPIRLIRDQLISIKRLENETLTFINLYSSMQSKFWKTFEEWHFL